MSGTKVQKATIKQPAGKTPAAPRSRAKKAPAPSGGGAGRVPIADAVQAGVEAPSEVAPPWWPTEEEIDNDEWLLFGTAEPKGEPLAKGPPDVVLTEALRRRIRGFPSATVLSPDRTHVVAREIEQKLDLASKCARRWSVELQAGGAKTVLARGKWPDCVLIYEKYEKDLQAGTIAFLDPSGGVYMQKNRAMFRTTVTTPADKDRIDIDEESYKQYLDGAEGTPAVKPEVAGDPPPAVPAPTAPAVQPPPAPPAAPSGPPPAPPTPFPPQGPTQATDDLLFEVQVLERVLVREREAQIQLAASLRPSGQQMSHVEAVLARLRGKP